MHYLYRLTNQINGKIYIGQTNDLARRWQTHKNAAVQNKPTQIIHYAIIKHGVVNFIFDHIATCQTWGDANELETLLVTQYESHIETGKGYNSTRGGFNAPKTEEWKQQISKLAQKRAPETSKQMTIIAADRPEDYYDYMKGNIINAGRVQPLEWKKKIQACNNTEEVRAKKSATLKEAYAAGRRISAQKGKPAWNKGKKGQPSPTKTKWTDEQIAAIKNDNRSSYKVAADYNVSSFVIQKLRKQLGIVVPLGNTSRKEDM